MPVMRPDIRLLRRRLIFRQPAATSRGIYHTHTVWYVVLTEGARYGVGECAPLPGLSPEYRSDEAYEQLLADTCRQFAAADTINLEQLTPHSSVRFGFETAWRHYTCGTFALWPTAFAQGTFGIPVNGLIWMADRDAMQQQIDAKLAAGFRCIKLKIGAIAFDDELELLRRIRRRYNAADVELRVDANGAFAPADAPRRLERLAQFDLHSIEQPIAAGRPEQLAELCRHSPLPIALDEELIGLHTDEARAALLDTVRPHYIVLKPTLHGGWSGANGWIDAARQRGVGWWITSALESNIGLNAIAQWCATLGPAIPQGLGTGLLYTNNVPMPLRLDADRLNYDPHASTPTSDMLTDV